MPKSAHPVRITTALILIELCRKYLIPWQLHSCRFVPSCTEYAKAAVVRRGLIAGGWLSFKRILKCHPFVTGGVDPI